MLKRHLILFLLFLTLSAAQALDLNSTKVLVETNDRTNADYLKLAFVQILSKNSGESISKILQNPFLDAINIKQGVKRSYFERIPHQYHPQDSQYNFWLHVLMDEEFIQRAMISGELGVWPKRRESITLWLAEESNEEPLKLSQNPEYTYWLTQWAEALGVEIQFPSENHLLDSSINPFMVKNLSYHLTEYSLDVLESNQVAAVYVQQNEEEIKFRYGFSSNQSDYFVRHINDSQENIASDFYQILADLVQYRALSERIEFPDIHHHTVQILITELKNYQSVLELNRYLDSLTVIDSYEVIAAKQNQQVIRANIKLRDEAFRRFISNGEKLTPINDGSIHQLVFEWN